MTTSGRGSIRIVAFHYPRPEHSAELVERIKRAAEVMASCRGFVDADCWLEEGSTAVVSVGTFESLDDWRRAAETVARADVDFAFDDRELKPREVHTLRRV